MEPYGMVDDQGWKPVVVLPKITGKELVHGSGTELGVAGAVGYCSILAHRGRQVAVAKWTIWVEATRSDGSAERIEIASLERDVSSPTADGLGLRLAEAKELLLKLQAHLSRDQVRQVTLRQPRWRPCACDQTGAQRKTGQARCQSWTAALIGGRATPELVRVQAELGARLSFREAARVMSVLLPKSRAINHTGVRRRLARTADRLQVLDDASPHRMSRAKRGPMVVSYQSP